MDASFFSELLKQYGLWTTVATVIAIYIIKDVWTRYSSRLFQKKNTVSLKTHSAFKEFDKLIEHSIKEEFTCECPIRKAIYRDILIERMKCFKDGLFKFVSTDLDDKNEYPTKYDFFLKVSEVLNDAATESRNNSITSGIPEFILNDIDAHRAPMRYMMMDMIKVTCHSEYTYASNTERMRAILYTVIVFIKNYMDMLEEVLASFNGDIKTMNYRGIICKNCKVCIHDDYIKRMKTNLQK